MIFVSRGLRQGSVPYAGCVVIDPKFHHVYITPEIREEAMKLLEKDDRYQQAHDPVVMQFGSTTAAYITPKAKEKAVELHAKTEQDEYNKNPKVVRGANPQFLVVRYGWYAFAFLLEEGDVRGPELNAKAIQMCEALLTLESGDESKYLVGQTKVVPSGKYIFDGERWLRIAVPGSRQ